MLCNSLAISLLLNLLFAMLCLGIGGFHYGAIDDYFMASIVTGAYGGEFDAHTLFVNGVYACFLKPFYILLPSVGWYFIFELLAVFLSFCGVTYLLLRKVSGAMGLFLAVFILACTAPDFYTDVCFTQCAAVLTAAGALFLYFGYTEQKKNFLLVGFLAMVAGIIFRREAFLSGMPFLFALFCYGYWKYRNVSKITVAVLVALVGAYFALQSFNKSLFVQEGFSYYLDYQTPRAILGDGAYYDSQNVYDELEERGMSGRDFELLERWVFYDKSAFSLDSIRPIVDIALRNKYDLNYAKLPVALFLAVAKSFFCTYAWCWAVLCLLFFYLSPAKACKYTWGVLALICVCLSFLLLQNRVVHYVETGIWLYAIICAVPLMDSEEFGKMKLNRKVPYLGMALSFFCLIFSLQNSHTIENSPMFFGKPKVPEDWKGLLDHVETHPDNVYLMPFNYYKGFGLFKEPAYRATAPGSLGNIIPIGYWNINLPGMEIEMKRRGVENPLHDVLHDNVYLVDDYNGLHLERFYERHYHAAINADTVARFGEIKLLKFHIADSEL